ncbi:hypothetical protein B0H63DRAFT_236345 [Podospora didyma]|uniref:Uncharacterized protein n=1 Tax=Podospora didyma TaxID=330526 RepID=A0AAE0KKB9_9PEZI|nr:hypothetical protein B0H63DRAFT_236345 [Podospora didyma]
MRRGMLAHKPALLLDGKPMTGIVRIGKLRHSYSHLQLSAPSSIRPFQARRSFPYIPFHPTILPIKKKSPAWLPNSPLHDHTTARDTTRQAATILHRRHHIGQHQQQIAQSIECTAAHQLSALPAWALGQVSASPIVGNLAAYLRLPRILDRPRRSPTTKPLKRTAYLIARSLSTCISGDPSADDVLWCSIKPCRVIRRCCRGHRWSSFAGCVCRLPAIHTLESSHL